MLEPGAVIGIVGGGQLGRMMALAAYRLGFRVHVFCQDENEPLAHITPLRTLASFDNAKARDAFAQAVDVITIEFENLPVEMLAAMAHITPLHPSVHILEIAQNRLREKELVAALAPRATPPYQPINTPSDLHQARQDMGLPLVIKTVRDGYDGKGQWVARRNDDLDRIAKALDSRTGIAEPLIDFAYETSAIITRNATGNTCIFPCPENQHEQGMLRRSLVPGVVGKDQAAQACDLAQRLADHMGLVGTLAVECFVTRDGQVLFNEMAPRPHNSGHWTQDGCSVDQFEQHIRAVANWPLLPAYARGNVRMDNLIGDDVRVHDIRHDGHLHLYGKSQCREGRKMGHVNYSKPIVGN